jgi:hypothetical protein
VLALPLVAATAAYRFAAAPANAATPSPRHDTFGLKIVITNNTDQNWTSEAADSHTGTGSTAHGEQRAQRTRDAHTSEPVTTETDHPASLEAQVTYQMANGEYSWVEVTDW